MVLAEALHNFEVQQNRSTKDSGTAIMPTSHQTQSKMTVTTSLSRHYGTDNTKVLAASDLLSETPKRERVAILGRSRSGKSILLNLIGGLVTPSSRAISVNRFEPPHRTTLCLITHDESHAKDVADRVMTLRDGTLAGA